MLYLLTPPSETVKKIKLYFFTVGRFTSYMSSLVNPVMYNVTSKKFRRVLKVWKNFNGYIYSLEVETCKLVTIYFSGYIFKLLQDWVHQSTQHDKNINVMSTECKYCKKLYDCYKNMWISLSVYYYLAHTDYSYPLVLKCITWMWLNFGQDSLFQVLWKQR